MAAIMGVLALCLCVIAVCLGGYGAVVAPILAPIVVPPDPPAASEFFGDWCSPQGDVLTLRAARFAVADLSPTLAGQIVHDGPTFQPGKSYRWDQPPATSAAGSWRLSVLGADLLAGQTVSIEIAVEQLDGEAVQSDDLLFDVYDEDHARAFSLPLRPAGSGDLTFTRCAAGAGAEGRRTSPDP